MYTLFSLLCKFQAVTLLIAETASQTIANVRSYPPSGVAPNYLTRISSLTNEHDLERTRKLDGGEEKTERRLGDDSCNTLGTNSLDLTRTPARAWRYRNYCTDYRENC